MADTAANAFGGQGSMGNGGAMRVAPLGAYFADDLGRCAEEARASALVTHTHPEGVAGAIAVAVAAAMAWQLRDASQSFDARKFFDEILRLTPEGKTRRGILLASQTPAEIPFQDVAKALGNGSLVTARTLFHSVSGWQRITRGISWKPLAKPSAWGVTVTQMLPSLVESSH